MCGKEEETLKHIFKKCPETKIEGIKWKKAINGKRSSFRFLNSTLWKRRKKEKEKDKDEEAQAENNTEQKQ